MNSGDVPEGVRLSRVPELHGVVPPAANDLVGRFRIETGGEHPRLVAVHNVRGVALERQNDEIEKEDERNKEFFVIRRRNLA